MAKSKPEWKSPARSSSPSAVEVESQPDSEQELRELAQSSHSSHRFDGLKAAVSDKGKLNHTEYSLAGGYADGSEETTELRQALRAGSDSQQAQEQRAASDTAQGELDRSGDKPTSGKQDSKMVITVGSRR